MTIASVGIVAAALAALAQPGDLNRGKAIYEQRCVVCHGPEGRGDGVQAPFLSPRPASLISAATSVKTDQELLRIIANGKPRTAMPAWKDVLSEEEQRDVLRYIRSLIRFGQPTLTPPPPSGNR
ncbi:MAG TPA: cytochrome c [Nitrospiraceae bacterium]|nr:cytochrome c [Nitrospiraceae bacterium]